MIFRARTGILIVMGVLVMVVGLWYRSDSGGADDMVPSSVREPQAQGTFTASPLAPDFEGKIDLHQVDGGTWIKVEVRGLPEYRPAGPDGQPIGPHGFHVHEFGVCDVGDPDDPFAGAGGHWNPDDQPHGNHAGDFPVLFSDRGTAFLSFITHRFMPQEVIGLSVVVHESPDDYRSQPSGDSGRRIACAVIGPPQD